MALWEPNYSRPNPAVDVNYRATQQRGAVMYSDTNSTRADLLAHLEVLEGAAQVQLPGSGQATLCSIGDISVLYIAFPITQ